jgi:RNA polymerase sigma factor (sigma-70 family)
VNDPRTMTAEELLARYGRLARAVADRITMPVGCCLGRGDLKAIGHWAMVRAAGKYDPGRGSFATFAWVVMRKEMLRAVYRATWGPWREGSQFGLEYKMSVPTSQLSAEWADEFQSNLGRDDLRLSDIESADQLARVLRSVTPKQAAALGAIVDAGHDHAEAARRLGWSPALLSWHWRQAVEQLRRRFPEECVA